VRLKCEDCGQSRLVAFSCKGRGFCPSCLGRRMNATSANLIERVLPPRTGLRQWVLTPAAAWTDSRVKVWLNDRNATQLTDLRHYLLDRIRAHYDQRARTLKENHPLGVQVHLETGVANGVLVARTFEDCAELLRRVLLRRLEFRLDATTTNGHQYLLLCETISGCIYRVMTGDSMLTNTFWNFYLNPSHEVDIQRRRGIEE
jgi:hypothetical protein